MWGGAQIESEKNRWLAILSVSRAIRAEAVPLYYSVNVWWFSAADPVVMFAAQAKANGEEALNRITKLRLEIDLFHDDWENWDIGTRKGIGWKHLLTHPDFGLNKMFPKLKHLDLPFMDSQTLFRSPGNPKFADQQDYNEHFHELWDILWEKVRVEKATVSWLGEKVNERNLENRLMRKGEMEYVEVYKTPPPEELPWT